MQARTVLNLSKHRFDTHCSKVGEGFHQLVEKKNDHTHRPTCPRKRSNSPKWSKFGRSTVNSTNWQIYQDECPKNQSTRSLKLTKTWYTAPSKQHDFFSDSDEKSPRLRCCVAASTLVWNHLARRDENRCETASLWFGHAHKTLHATKSWRLFIAHAVKHLFGLREHLSRLLDLQSTFHNSLFRKSISSYKAMVRLVVMVASVVSLTNVTLTLCSVTRRL